ncbi:uncharacterized protein LOC119667116 [Teleopsis dalmanni]|uniref:uncharacterized protein LOC119667116 n=1 Tax=Teleopsis dalmanni TaxID=139649 RepID=UPI0018CF6A2D|nr:uncharacterized protein LOC119667116 [Teleopsis dalmanni]
MEPLFQLWDMQIVQLIVVHMNSTTRIPGDRIYNMMLTDSYTAFLKTDIASYTRDNNNNEYYFIFLQTPDHLLKDEMQQIFNYCWLHYLINCVVQVQTERGEVLLYTYFPFTAKYCYKIEPVLFNQFKGAGFTKSELFPRKLKNFYGCKLKAALWHLVPLVTLETNAEGQVKINGGFEGNMLNVLAQKLNFSVEIWIPPEAVKRGTLVNGSFNGAIGMIEKHTADLTIAGFRQTLERSRVASPTVVYRQDHVVAVVYKAAYQFNSFELLVHPFTTYVWTILLITVILALITQCFENTVLLKSRIKTKDTSKSFLHIFRILLGLPVLQLTNNSGRRLLLILWFWVMFIIRNSYQALLFHLIHTQTSKPIPNSIDKILTQNYTFLMNKDILNDVSLAKKFVFEVVPNGKSPLNLLENTSRGPLVGITTNTILAYFVHQNRKAGDYFLIPQQIVSFYMTMYLSKHSFLLDEFNKQISWIVSTGLMNAWLSREIDNNYLFNGQVMQDHLFGMKELWAAFLVIIIGVIISSCVFTLEFISSKSKFVQKLF